MDAIFGIYNRSGAPVDAEILANMGARLSHRSAHGIREWGGGNVALGFCGDSTPGSPEKEGDPGTAGCVAVADARIDNAAELEKALGIDGTVKNRQEDLLAEAYARWGRACVNHLVGDYAFAVWDEGRRELFCARDPFGIRPLYYCLTADAFLFATEIEALLEAPFVPRDLDEWSVAAQLTGTFLDKESTTYKAIRRLAAAHSVIVTAGGLRFDRYWDPRNVSDTVCSSDLEYEARFRKLLDDAVTVRLQGASRPAVQLSGGLDSSSIAGVVHSANRRRTGIQTRISTYSAVYPELPECDERPFIDSVLQDRAFASHFVEPAEHSPLAERQARPLRLAEPLYWPTWPMEYAIFSAARADGIDVLLSGHGGDHVLAAHPTGYYADLLRTGRWLTLVREIQETTSVLHYPARRLVWGGAVKPLVLGAVPPRVLRSYRRFSGAETGIGSELNSVLLRRIDFKERVMDGLAREEREHLTARGAHASLVDHTQTQYGFERLNLVSSRFGLDLRHPFWHRPLVEFCLGIPRGQLYRGASTRDIMRRALAAELPEAVQRRRTKASFNSLLCSTLWKFESEALAKLMSDPEPVSEWIDVAFLLGAYSRFTADPILHFREARILLSALTFALWQRAG